MSQKEKAKELVDKFYKYAHDGNNGSYYDTKIWTKNAKQCALIAIDNILQSHYNALIGIKPSIYKYWKEVKQEIEKL